MVPSMLQLAETRPTTRIPGATASAASVAPTADSTTAPGRTATTPDHATARRTTQRTADVTVAGGTTQRTATTAWALRRRVCVPR